MKSLTSKSKAALIALFLVLTMAVALVALPNANAVILPQRDTFAMITANPDPIGVGQEALIVMWLTEPLPSTEMGWEGYELTITKPDLTTIDGGTFRSESTGSTYSLFTPTEAGTWKFQFTFPGQWLNQTFDFSVMGPSERWYKPSTSNLYELTVQDEPVLHYPAVPLPTDYWERPIYGEHTNWAPIGGNFLVPAGGEGPGGFGLGNLNRYTSGPETAHVMWTKQHDFGGIVGGNDDRGFASGLSYQRKWRGIIINGRLYYSNPNPPQASGFHCVDLRTGEEYFSYDDEGGASGFGWNMFGQVMEFDSPNQHGSFAYLWYSLPVPQGSPPSYALYDPFSGQYLCTIANVSSGSMSWGPSGELLIYNLYSADLDGDEFAETRQLSLWNSTRVLGFTGPSWQSASWSIPYGQTLDGNSAYMWVKNVTSVSGNPGAIRLSAEEDIIYCSTQVLDASLNTVAVHCAYDLDGNLRWAENRTGLQALVNFVNMGAMGEGIYCEYVRETLTWYAYDITDGSLKWTHKFDNPWSVYYGCSAIAYGTFFTGHYDGLHALDVETGEELWHFSAPAGFETPYGIYPIFTFHDGITVADGKVYGVTGEHSPNDPLYKGERLYCINGTDGTEIWSISCWGLPPAVADGYAATLNHYQNRIYVYGKGPSATTVTAPDSGVILGNTIVIKGTVTDQSEAQTGTACISDDSMSAWMEYLHMQKPMPSNATGVTVTIDVLDSNNNYRTIGTTTSDTAGNFGFAWEPDIPGFYTVIATFAGSNAYGSSYDVTYFNVEEAPQPTPTPTPTPAPMTDTYVLGLGLTAIIVLIIIGAVIILMLRKR